MFVFLVSTTTLLLALFQQSSAAVSSAADIFLAYSYANTKGCLQTNLLHLPILEMTEAGNGLDVGTSNSTTVEPRSCREQGYSLNTSFYFGLPHESIPKFIIDEYAGVTAGTFFDDFPMLAPAQLVC